MVDYVNLKAIADRLISENGRDITVVRFDTNANDATQPWDGPTNPRLNTTEEVIKAVVVEPDSTVALGELTKMVDLTSRSDKIFIAQAGVEDLTTFNEIQDGDRLWKIDNVKSLQPGNLLLLYFIEASR